MAVASSIASQTMMPPPCNAKAHEDGDDANRKAAEPPTTAVGDGDVVVYKKGAWSKEEDEKLRRAVEEYGIKNWVTIEKFSGLGRPAKNCRLRWLNYLRPNLKKYPFTDEEERLILELHEKYGNSWSRIASKLPGRSDNEIKNFWHKRSKRCKRENLPIYPTTQENKQKQCHTNVPTINDNHSTTIEPNANVATDHDNYFPTNYPNHTLPQFQPSTLNVVNNNAYLPTDAPSIHSPQTMISTPQPQFLSSPSSLITTSHQPSPTNHLSHQPTLFPNTPTSQTPNLLLSPHQTSHPTETTFSIPDHLQASLSWQGDASSNAFTSLRKPPILSSPKGPLRRFLEATSQLSPGPGGHSIPGSAHLAVNASTFLPSDSSLQMQWSSAMESPRSPLKLKLSPGILPAQYSVQMSTQTADSTMPSLSQFQLKSPTSAPLSPLNLHLSVPLPSNLSVPDSTVQLNSSTSAVPLSSPQLEQSQPMTLDTDHTVLSDSSHTVKEQPPSVQFHPPETSGVDSCMHEVESDSDSEIMDELRKAQARVRFLKKRLRQRRISNKRSLLKKNSRKKLSPEATNLSKTEVVLDRNSSQGTIKDCALSRTSSRTKNFLRGYLRVLRRKSDMIGISPEVKRARKENRENLESGEYMQGSITPCENSESRIFSDKSLQREEDSGDEIYNRESSQTLQEQRHSIDLLDQLNSQNNGNARNSDSWDNKLCTFQGPAGNECSSMEGLLSDSSNLLQECFLKGDLFGQGSRIEDPFYSYRHLCLTDSSDPVYGQITATTQLRPGDESGQLSYLEPDDFGCSFGREFSHGLERMDSNLAARSLLYESDLSMHENPAPAGLFLDSSYLVSKPPIIEHEYMGCEQFPLQNSGRNLAETKLCEPSLIQHQYHAADLLESSYLASKQIMEQESFRGVQFSLQTSGSRNSSETSKLCQLQFLLHQSPAASLKDSRYLVGFEHECPRGEQYSLQNSDGEYYRGRMNTECTSRLETDVMETLLTDTFYPPGQMQDQTFSVNYFDSVINPMESNNWNNEYISGHTGGVPQQEHDHMNITLEELSSPLDVSPTTVQTLQWSNIGNEIPDDKASEEFGCDVGLSHNISSTSPPLITIADYI